MEVNTSVSIGETIMAAIIFIFALSSILILLVNVSEIAKNTREQLELMRKNEQRPK